MSAWEDATEQKRHQAQDRGVKIPRPNSAQSVCMSDCTSCVLKLGFLTIYLCEGPLTAKTFALCSLALFSEWRKRSVLLPVRGLSGWEFTRSWFWLHTVHPVSWLRSLLKFSVLNKQCNPPQTITKGSVVLPINSFATWQSHFLNCFFYYVDLKKKKKKNLGSITGSIQKLLCKKIWFYSKTNRPRYAGWWCYCVPPSSTDSRPASVPLYGVCVWVTLISMYFLWVMTLCEEADHQFTFAPSKPSLRVDVISALLILWTSRPKNANCKGLISISLHCFLHINCAVNAWCS